MRYTARIQHSEETFRRLSKVQYDAFCGGKKAAAILFALAAFFCGAFAGWNEAVSMTLLFFACWILMSLELPAKRNGDRLIKMANGKFPETFYTFEKEKIQLRCGDQTGSLDYGTMCAFFEDAACFYLFPSRQSGYLIPKDTLQPPETEAFREFLQKETGLTPRRPGPFWKLAGKADLLRRGNRTLRQSARHGDRQERR